MEHFFSLSFPSSSTRSVWSVLFLAGTDLARGLNKRPHCTAHNDPLFLFFRNGLTNKHSLRRKLRGRRRTPSTPFSPSHQHSFTLHNSKEEGRRATHRPTDRRRRRPKKFSHFRARALPLSSSPFSLSLSLSSPLAACPPLIPERSSSKRRARLQTSKCPSWRACVERAPFGLAGEMQNESSELRIEYNFNLESSAWCTLKLPGWDMT